MKIQNLAVRTKEVTKNEACFINFVPKKRNLGLKNVTIYETKGNF